MRIDIFSLRIFLVRPKCRRFTEATVRTFVFPAIDGQFVTFKMVVGACKIIATAFGAVADRLTVTGHSSS